MAISVPDHITLDNDAGSEIVSPGEDILAAHWQAQVNNAHWARAFAAQTHSGAVPYGSEAPITRASIVQPDETQRVELLRGIHRLGSGRDEVRIWARYEGCQDLQIDLVPILGTGGASATWTATPSATVTEYGVAQVLGAAGGVYRWTLSAQAWDGVTPAKIYAVRIKDTDQITL